MRSVESYPADFRGEQRRVFFTAPFDFQKVTRTLTDTDRWNVLQAKSQEAKVQLAFIAFRKHAIEPLLIKGWAAARVYPSDRVRRPGDIDLAVSSEDYEAARQLTRSEEFSKFNIDLHKELRHLDTMAWDQLVARSQLVDIDGTPIRVLCPEDHLRLLCVHWLTDGGGYRDKLWDIFYSVENRPADFDWVRCLGSDSVRRSWVIITIGLTHKFLGLEVADLPFADEAEKIPDWIVRCVQREWRREGRLEPILTSVHDKTLLVRQIGRRIPPNPIRATIEANGDLLGNLRWWYQILVIARRLGPFLRDTLFVTRLYSTQRGPK